ncbi:hypothetical protein BX666DRAFT_1954441 [Dichotomocladium elegans]|nr:hypothetical protein BX666DRAFT_1954441 [Dichotomocladium elegans]
MSDLQLKKRYIAGIYTLGLVVLIWVSSSFAVNNIFGDLNYDKPFLVTYLNTATFTGYLIPEVFSRCRGRKGDNSEEIAMGESPLQAQEDRPSQMEQKETIRLSLVFCILWFGANYTTNASLAYTSVGSSTILSSTSGLFTLAMGTLFGVERLTTVRAAAVAISFIGVVLISYIDHIGSRIQGDLLALTGAFFYGLYTTLLKLRIGDESRINMPLFFGYVGVFNILLLWPFIPILHWTNVETFELPPSGMIWAILLLNAFIGTFLSDYLWLLAMLMTSPLVATLGVSLTIPLALAGDLLIKHTVLAIQYIIGAILVVAGFLAVNIAALSEVSSSTDYASIPQADNTQI